MMKIDQKHRGSRILWLFIPILLIVIGSYGYLSYNHPLVVNIPYQPSNNANPDVSPIKKTEQEKKSYTVPSDHPRELIIHTLSIDANILSLGVTASNTLDAPKTAWDVGWYNKSALPGSDSGALLIDGHVNDSLGSQGIFYGINTLKPGDGIDIQRGDGETISYSVVHVEQVPIAQVDMNKMLRSITPGKEGLNLITCGGVYDSKRKTYDDRILVYAIRIS